MTKLFYCVVVNDEPLAAQVIQNYSDRISNLELVAKCESVEEAYDIVKSREVDLIFLDLDLRGYPGLSLVDKLKKETRRYYIIITSAFPEDTAKLSAAFKTKNIQLVEYLTKPFSFAQFSQAIDKIPKKS